MSPHPTPSYRPAAALCTLPRLTSSPHRRLLFCSSRSFASPRLLLLLSSAGNFPWFLSLYRVIGGWQAPLPHPSDRRWSNRWVLWAIRSQWSFWGGDRRIWFDFPGMDRWLAWSEAELFFSFSLFHKGGPSKTIPLRWWTPCSWASLSELWSWTRFKFQAVTCFLVYISLSPQFESIFLLATSPAKYSPSHQEWKDGLIRPPKSYR